VVEATVPSSSTMSLELLPSASISYRSPAATGVARAAKVTALAPLAVMTATVPRCEPAVKRTALPTRAPTAKVRVPSTSVVVEPPVATPATTPIWVRPPTSTGGTLRFGLVALESCTWTGWVLANPS
jgi:hypothetical protein